MYLFFYMALGLNDFDASNIHYEGHWKGWALKSRLFGPIWHSLHSVAISGPKKSRFQGPTPSYDPRNGYCLHQNLYVLRNINNRYINSYIHTGKGGWGGEELNQREWERDNREEYRSQSWVENTNMTECTQKIGYLQSVISGKHLSQSPFTGKFL